LLIGYGPETLPLVIRRLMTAPSGLTPDRFHNLIWDTLAAGGVAGLVATLGLMLGLFHSGLRRLGLIASPRQNAWFWASVAGGGGAGAIVAMSIYGSAASAAGFQLGLVAGQLAYLAGLLLPGTEAPTPGPLDQGDVLVAALWAGLIGHLAEVGFSFPVVATNILFWAYAALLQPTFAVAGDETEPAAGASSPRMRPRGRAPATSTSRHRRPPRAARPASWWWLPAIRDGAIVTIIVITMGFLLLGTLQPSSVRDVLGNALAMSRSGPGVSLLVALALVGVWVGAAMILAMSTSPEGSVRARSLGGMLLVSGLLGALYWTWLAVDLSGLSRQAIADGPSVLASAAGHARLFTNYCVWLLALLITFAAARSASGPAVPSRWTAPAVIAAPAMLGLALVAAWFVALRPAYADTIAATASSAHRAGLWEGAKLAYRRAIALAPDVEHYRVELGKVSFDQSRRAAGPRRDALLREAEQAWKDLHARGPLYWSYAPLASLYTTWALETSDASRRLELARRAEAQFARAVVLGPKDPDIWHSWAYLEWTLLGRPAEARAKDLRALELDPRFEPALALMGRYESSRWRERPGSEDGRQALRQAVRYYERAAAVTRNKYPHLMAMAEAQAALGEGERAIATYVSARPLASPPEVWKVDEALARLYASTGERDLARRHATLALQSAPPEARRRLESFLTRLR
jgi:hypothetical protein